MTRIPLFVQTGRLNVLYVHDIADSAVQRAALFQRAAGAWWVDLRGHGRSGWVRGGGYDIAGFTSDVLKVLLRMPPGATLVGQGIGGLLAAAAAAIVPDRVSAVELLPGEQTAWTPETVLTGQSTLLPNPDWLYAKDFGEMTTDGPDDPLLRLGPPAPVPLTRLRSILAGLRCPVHGSAGWVDEVIPR